MKMALMKEAKIWLKNWGNSCYKFPLTLKRTSPILNTMFYTNPITVKRSLKAAWHIRAVAEEAFY